MLGTVLDAEDAVVIKEKIFNPFILEGIRYKYTACHVTMVDTNIAKARRKNKVCVRDYILNRVDSGNLTNKHYT